MKRLSLPLVAAGLGTASFVLAQALAVASPQGGQWALEVELKGAPLRSPAPRQLCLSAQALAQEPERVLLEAAMQGLQGEDGAAPRCVLSELKREAQGAQWQARCEGPRGPLQGTGVGLLAPQSATLTQRFELATPLGARTLTQTVRARRSGPCLPPAATSAVAPRGLV